MDFLAHDVIGERGLQLTGCQSEEEEKDQKKEIR
jgi:hypothetical protein